jgi:hypothetical protein
MSATALAYVAATTLAIETAAMLLAMRFPQWGGVAIFASVALGSVVGRIAYAMRKGIAEYIGEMAFAERALFAIVLVLLFAAPSLWSKQWEPALGGVVVLAALTAMLSTPASFYALYVAASLAHAATLPVVRGEVGNFVVAIFLSTLLVANVADHFAFRAQFLRLSRESTARTIFSALVVPWFAALLVAGAALLLLPEGTPLLSRGPLSSGRVQFVARFDGELATVGNALFRVASLLMVSSGVLFLYWLHRRWQLRRAQRLIELEEEMLADYFMELGREKGAKRTSSRPRTLRGKMVAAFERFLVEGATAGFPRREPMTVQEYLTVLRQRELVSAEIADKLLREFLPARYGKAHVKKEDVQRFSKLVEQAIADLQARLTSAVRAN